MVDCSSCGGPLKPDVVYFGESVPPARVTDSYALVEGASALLVLGSSLHVYSGRRFVTHAHKLGLPIVIVNQGETKADELATVRIDAPLGATLSTLSLLQ
jgi:NAD-dependent SIR2 family protein deacetylase